MTLIERLTDLQTRRPWAPLLFVAAVTAVMAAFAWRLELRTRYEALLPDHQPSVEELRRVEGRVSAAQHVLVLLEGEDAAALRAMGDALVPALLALGPDTISSAEDGAHEARRYLSPRAGLFVDVTDLEVLRRDVDARWDWEVAHESGFALDDGALPPPLDVKAIEDRLTRAGEARAGARGARAWPDGYYQSEDGRALVVVARSPIAGGDLTRIGAALARVEGAVASVRASRPDFARVRVGYAGDMPTGYIEYGVIKDDLLGVGALGIGLVLLVVLLYFMRLRALFVMGVTIAVGLVWTFGVTQLAIGHLNIATGFLVSIVAGNGINVGILYQARYFEERRKGAPPEHALRTAVHATWQPTIIAAVAAAASYGSLLVTDFRAFRHFGFIAAAGMLLCWLAKTLMVPPLLLLVDRRRPVAEATRGGLLSRLRAQGTRYGAFFARVVPVAPRALLAAAALLVVAGAFATARWVEGDPMEYDLAKVQNDRAATAELHRVWDVVNRVLGGSHGAMVVLADTPEEARELDAELRARWDAAPADAKPFVSVTSLWALVPERQPEKVPVLLAIAERVERAHERGIVSDADWARVAPYLPPKDLAPFGIADLPAEVARPFTERDGTRGTLVLVEPEATSSEDLRYLLRYAGSFRETRLASGKVVRGSGRAVVFADILSAVVRDIPKALSLSLALTLGVVVLAFRRGPHLWTVLFALVVGVAGIGAFLALSGARLNFLNFAALPITFGIGVDYAVNVAQRHRADGGDILGALRTTGGAVVLCSLTTTVGYLALLGSHNQAIRSLGAIAVVGEVSCLLAAMLALPAVWLLVERRAKEVTS